MKRAKLIASLMMCVFCLSFLVVGVWAAVTSVNFNLNGNLQYYPEGVYVELSGQVYRGNSTTSLEPLTSDTRFTLEPTTNFDNSTGEPSGNFPMESWEIGNLPFAPQLKYIKIEVNITNYSEIGIIAIPEVTGTVTTSSDINLIDNGILDIQSDRTATYEITLQLEETAEQITDLDLNISFDLRKPDYNYFLYETADGQSSDSKNGTVIVGLDTTDYTSETAPEILIVPGFNESGVPLSIKGEYTNDGYKNLVSSTIILQSGLTSILSTAFKDCTNLISIKIPDTVTIIDDGAFWSCTNLTNVSIPENVTRIGTYAFSGCTSLTNIELPSGLTSIGEYAFQSCTSLTSIEIPIGITDIYSNTFGYCPKLKYIHLLGNLTSPYNLDGTWQYSAIELSTPNWLSTTTTMQAAGWYYQQSAWNA